MKELSNALDKKQNKIFKKTICNEIYNEIPLANTYKNQIEKLVDKYMTEMAYDRDFFIMIMTQKMIHIILIFIQMERKKEYIFQKMNQKFLDMKQVHFGRYMMKKKWLDQII